MYTIVQKRKLAIDTFLIEIEAQEIAKKALSGQFVIVRINDQGERIPLTIADTSKKTITLIVQAIGKTTKLLATMKKSSTISNVTGPLGNPTNIQQYGNVCLVAGGLGIGAIYPVAKALKEKGNKTIVIIGAKSKKHLFWEDKLKEVSDKLLISTDDGSYGTKGFVTDLLKQQLKTKSLNFVFTVGPLIMMKAISDMTRQLVRTTASINTIMIDGIGMCGGCRLKYGSEIKFSCVDGPDFDAHKVDFNDLLKRNSVYQEEEKHACRCARIKV